MGKLKSWHVFFREALQVGMEASEAVRYADKFVKKEINYNQLRAEFKELQKKNKNLKPLSIEIKKAA